MKIRSSCFSAPAHCRDLLPLSNVLIVLDQILLIMSIQSRVAVIVIYYDHIAKAGDYVIAVYDLA